MTTAAELRQKRCKPCEGGVTPLAADQIRDMMSAIPQWQLAGTGKSLQREWRVKDFDAAVRFFNAIGRVAEEQDHHPDLHLTGYRNVRIDLSTHAIGGLSENDFILAACIDQVPVELKK
jgi:4a-hydroxytetrahydrobiopterin dehydratase